MKNIFKIILAIFIITIGLTACDEDRVNFDAQGGQTLVTFGRVSASLSVPANGSNTITIPVDVTTVSSVERTYNAYALEDGTTAPASTYEIGQVVIPADSHNGELTITGIDNDLTDEPYTINVAIDAGNDLSEGSVLINIFEFCEVSLADFVGVYSADENNGSYGPYEVTIEVNEAGDALIINNLWDVAGTTTAYLDQDAFSVEFVDGEFLFESADYGDAGIYNLGGYESTFDACTKEFDLYFQVCVSAGCFTGGFLDGVEQRVQLTYVGE